MANDTEDDRPEADGPVALGVFTEADRFAAERFVDVDRATLPLDLAVPAHPPHRLIGIIAGLAQHAVEAPGRECVTLRRSIVAKRLVRTLLVVEALEGA